MKAKAKLATNLRARLVEHWPVKLTALLLSAVLWAVVAAEEPSTQLVAVELDVTPPPGRTLAQRPPIVQALYSGSARELLKLLGQPPRVVTVIPDTVTGTQFVLDLAVDDLMTPEGASVNAQAIQPRSISLVLDDAIARTVPVFLRGTPTADSGFALVRSPTVTPESVTVRGPAVFVAQVEAVGTVPLDMEELRGSTRQRISLDTTTLGGARPIPPDVEVFVQVGVISETMLMGVPVEIRADRSGTWESDRPAVVVTVRGLDQRVARLTRDSVRVVARISGAIAEETTALAVEAADGLTAWATPDSVIVRRRPRD
jgi:hypothetical protein